MIGRKWSSASRNAGDDRRSLAERKMHRSIFEITACGSTGQRRCDDGMANPWRDGRENLFTRRILVTFGSLRRPAAPDTGVVFRRVDLQQPLDIPATASRVGDTRLSSCLERDGVKVATVEHLMSAYAGLGIDNVYVDLTAAEVPIIRPPTFAAKLSPVPRRYVGYTRGR